MNLEIYTNMNITIQQLKKIISEEIKKSYLKEEIGMGPGSAELQTYLDIVCDGWKSQFDPNDPSMASEGKEAWDAQCDEASETLGEKIEESFMQTEESLYQGQFRDALGRKSRKI